ncbi:dihydroorotate dehydrogenase-like protein [Planctomycetota bacterium]|nr:dihydroorotate dehydrogenase-like protein [Planctomycetota bacterium]
MNLKTNYMGFQLDHPVIPGASPLCYEIDLVQGLLDAGAPMIVLRSLFEEDIRINNFRNNGTNYKLPPHIASEPIIEPNDYLKRLTEIKQFAHVPIVASINGSTPGGWVKYATQAIDAGADAIELNIYRIASETDLTSEDIEAEDIQIISELSKRITVPLAVKISSNYSAISNYAEAIREAGAQSLVIFNRFLQPNIDIEHRTLTYCLQPSTPDELMLRLRWAAILSTHVPLPLAITGGIKTGEDVIKAVMSGATVCQVVTPLLEQGPTFLTQIVNQIQQWCESHEIDSLDEIRGCMNLKHASDPRAYERGNYLQMLKNAASQITYSGLPSKISSQPSQ